MRWLSLFLASQHLSSGKNLRECEYQSWSKVKLFLCFVLIDVRCFRLFPTMSSDTPGSRPLFWDITSCSPFIANRRFGGTCLPHFQGWRTKTKQSKTYSSYTSEHRSHGVISQKAVVSTVTTARTSKPLPFLVYLFVCSKLNDSGQLPNTLQRHHCLSQLSSGFVSFTPNSH
jgi:hypothetical protein